MTRVPVAAGFHGFWPGFAGPDFLAFGARVRERFDVRVVEALEEAEVVVYSVFPDERPVPRHPHTSVFYTPECVPPDLDLFDFALSFHPLEHPRHLRLPNYVLRLRRNGLSPAALRRDGAVPAGAGSRRFCNFVHSNPVPFRERFCERLSGYRRVDAPGVSCNNMPPIGTGVADKLAFVSQYKFTLAFENESAVGYTTEKIVEPFLAGSVPIYWGNPEVARDFDPRSFINAHDFASEDELLEHIVRVDGDDDLYRSYLAASPYAGNVVPEVLRDETLDSFVERILSSGVRSTLDERFAGGFSFRPAGRRVRRLDVRSFATLAFAEEVVSAPELLAAYADAFSEADDASLVIYAPALDPGLAERLSAVAEEAGVFAPGGPDLLVVPGEAGGAHDAFLAAQVEAVLSQRPQAGVFSQLPRAGDGSIERLVALARPRWLSDGGGKDSRPAPITPPVPSRYTSASSSSRATTPLVLQAQLAALAGAGLTDRHEIVVVADAQEPARLPAALEGRVVVRRVAPVGRRAALALAAEAARSDICIALASIARPAHGFADPLAAAVRGGAGLAAPVLETAGGDVHGYRVAGDGSLWPLRAEDAEQPEALALDCLAAPRDFWLTGLPPFSAVEGHYELHVAPRGAAARSRSCAEARCRRVSVGPPASVVVCTQDRPDEIVACCEALLAAGAGGTRSWSSTTAQGRAARAARGRRLGSRAGCRALTRAQHGRRGGDARRARLPRRRRAPRTRLARASPRRLREPAGRGRRRPDPRALAGRAPAGWPEEPWTSYFSILSHGDADRTWPRGDFYGANWAVRRSALDAVGGFEHRFGASGDGLLAGEETAIEFLIAARGLGVARYAAGAAVGHRIDPARCDEGWLALRVYRHGLESRRGRGRLRRASRELATRVATEAAAELHAIAALDGRYDVDGALAEIAGSPLPLQHRVCAARALGIVASSVLLLGESECMLGPLQLTVRPEHANGDIARPPALLRAAA